MSLKITRRELIVAAAAATLVKPAFAEGTTHEVQMLNKHPEDKKLRNVFTPRLLKIKPGDSVKFIPVDKGHNSAFIKGMIPEGTEEWKGKINEEITVTFETPGVYGYQCTPHYSLGMVGMIIVEGEGMDANAEAARGVKHRGKGKKIFEEIWAEVDAENMLSMS